MTPARKLFSTNYYYSGTHKYLVTIDENDGSKYLEMVEGPDLEIINVFKLNLEFDPDSDLGYDSESENEYESDSESEIDDLDDELIEELENNAPEYDSGLEPEPESEPESDD